MGGATDSGDGALVGGDILELVTSGMYVDARCVYREYVQNAVDAMESAGMVGGGLVEIAIVPEEGRVVVRDNGPGVTFADARRALVAIARSGKRGRGLRGFRGIGRLAGLAFAERITFLTRVGEAAPVVRVVWERAALKAGIASGGSLASVLDRAVTVGAVSGSGYPARFFEVRMDGVSRHAASTIMNRALVRQYIGEVCPVPFREDFRQLGEVLEIFGEGELPMGVRVCLDDDGGVVQRPHGCDVKTSEQDRQEILEIEAIRIPGLEGKEWAAVGWIGHTRYRGAILKSCGVRGVRARVGNMQIGGEDVFRHLFSEDRFNRWCIGEIHVLESAIIPNARRDYFEPGVHLRDLENQLSAVCRRLEGRCRGASRERLRERRLGDVLRRGESSLDLASSGYVDADTAARLVEGTGRTAAEWEERCSGLPEQGAGSEALRGLTQRVLNFGAHEVGRGFPGVGVKEAAAYREIFGVLSEVLDDPALARQVIEAVLERREGQEGGSLDIAR